MDKRPQVTKYQIICGIFQQLLLRKIFSALASIKTMGGNRLDALCFKSLFAVLFVAHTGSGKTTNFLLTLFLCGNKSTFFSLNGTDY